MDFDIWLYLGNCIQAFSCQNVNLRHIFGEMVSHAHIENSVDKNLDQPPSHILHCCIYLVEEVLISLHFLLN